MDDDGDFDIFLTLNGQIYSYDASSGSYDQISSTRLLLNDGSATFTDATANELPDPADTSDHYLADAVGLGDLDADGDLDAILSSAFFTYYGGDSSYALKQFRHR